MSIRLADTGFLVAFLCERDLHYDWAFNQMAQQLAEGPFVTCEAVLAETTYLVTKRSGRSSARTFALLREGAIQLGFDLSEHQDQVARLLGTYRDRPIDLADACLVRMSEIYPDSTVVTTDSDFAVYRRFGSQLIPTITP